MILDAIAFLLFPITRYYILWITKHSGADYLNIHRWLLTKHTVRFLKKHGVKTCVWTVDNPRAIARLKALRVDGIFTNYPDRLN
jgi:glycerophosphoryl diester phosphodiesterase